MMVPHGPLSFFSACFALRRSSLSRLVASCFSFLIIPLIHLTMSACCLVSAKVKEASTFADGSAWLLTTLKAWPTSSVSNFVIRLRDDLVFCDSRSASFASICSIVKPSALTPFSKMDCAVSIGLRFFGQSSMATPSSTLTRHMPDMISSPSANSPVEYDGWLSSCERTTCMSILKSSAVPSSGSLRPRSAMVPFAHMSSSRFTRLLA